MPCQHPIKLNKLCALCGQEVQDTENTKFYNALHSNSRLMVDKSTIDGMYVRYRDELIQKKKMILVVDLDQTILHSIDVKGGRVGDNGSRNRNGECGGRGITNKQLLQARPRQPLPSSFTYTLASTTMKTTLRPHLHTFLTELNEMFHMHIYTMGTSEYVHQITNVIDRDGSLFGDRIVTRNDEVLVKRLERLFGDREDMVVVIDDRGDVWEYCGNLVMIRPFFGVDCGVEEGRGEEGSAQESSSMGITGRHQLSNKQYGGKGKSTSPSTSTTTPYSNYYANDKELLNLLHTLRSIHQQFYANPNQSAKSIITAQNKKIFKNKTFMVDRCIPDRYNVQSIIRMHGGVVGEDGCDVIVGDEGMVRWVMECVWRRRWIDCVGWMKGLDEWVDEVEKQL